MFMWFKVKKTHIISHTLYTIVAPLYSAFLKRLDFYKAHRSEKCYLTAPYRIVIQCPGETTQKQ